MYKILPKTGNRLLRSPSRMRQYANTASRSNAFNKFSHMGALPNVQRAKRISHYRRR